MQLGVVDGSLGRDLRYLDLSSGSILITFGTLSNLSGSQCPGVETGAVLVPTPQRGSEDEASMWVRC